jgi:hypothetical protein
MRPVLDGRWRLLLVLDVLRAALLRLGSSALTRMLLWPLPALLLLLGRGAAPLTLGFHARALSSSSL